jgi:hypothetical protein
MEFLRFFKPVETKSLSAKFAVRFVQLEEKEVLPKLCFGFLRNEGLGRQLLQVYRIMLNV